MPANKMRKLKLGDHEAMRLQDAVAEAIDPILALPLINSLLLVSQKDAQGNSVPLALTTSFQNIPHGLGRVPFGWVLVSPGADVRVWEDQAVATAALLAANDCNPDPTFYLRLKASAAVTCRILVF